MNLVKFMASPAQQFDRVVEHLRTAISAATLKPGDRLPTQRALASELGLSLPTVARGFATAQRLGLITSTVGRGSFVAGGPMEESASSFDLTINAPSRDVVQRVLGADLELFSREGGLSVIGGYPSARDSQSAIREIANWLQECGLDGHADEPILCEGAHHGLYLALQATCRPGDSLVCEDMTYPGLFAIAKALELTLHPVPTGHEGPQIAHLQDAVARTGATALFLVPTLQNPLGYVWAEARRRAIADFAKTKDLILIEDDVYRALADAPPPIANFAPDRTIYVTSLSKVLAPGLRLGIVSSPPSLAGRIRTLAHAHRYSLSPVSLALALRWFQNGLHRSVAQAHRRRIHGLSGIVRQILHSAAPVSAYHFWLDMPDRGAAEQVALEFARTGIHVPAPTAFSGSFQPSSWGLRLALGCLRSDDEARRVLSHMASIVEASLGPRAFVV